MIYHFQIFGHVSVARVRLFHSRIRNAYLAVWLARTSRADKRKYIFETSHVFRIIYKCWKFFLISKTSSGVEHSSVDRLWDDDRFTGRTSRFERLRLAVNFFTHRDRCTSVWQPMLNNKLDQQWDKSATTICEKWDKLRNISWPSSIEVWTSPMHSILHSDR